MENSELANRVFIYAIVMLPSTKVFAYNLVYALSPYNIHH